MNGFPGAAGATQPYIGDSAVAAGAMVPYAVQPQGALVKHPSYAQHDEEEVKLVPVGDRVKGVHFMAPDHPLPDFAPDADTVKRDHLGGQTWHDILTKGGSPSLPMPNRPIDFNNTRTARLRFGTEQLMAHAHEFPTTGNKAVVVHMDRATLTHALGAKVAEQKGQYDAVPVCIRAVNIGSHGISVPLKVKLMSSLPAGQGGKTSWMPDRGASAGVQNMGYSLAINPNTPSTEIDRAVYLAPENVEDPDYSRFASSNFGAIVKAVESYTAPDKRFVHVPMPSKSAVVPSSDVAWLAITRRSKLDQAAIDPEGKFGGQYEDYEPLQHVFQDTPHGSSLIVPKQPLLDEVNRLKTLVNAKETQMHLDNLEVHFQPLGSWATHGKVVKAQQKRPPGLREQPAGAHVEFEVDYVLLDREPLKPE